MMPPIMRINNRILKAINEGINKALLSFDDQNEISFDKSNISTDNKATKKGINNFILESVKNAIIDKAVFLPKTLDWTVNVGTAKYLFDILGNKLVLSTTWISSFDGKERNESGFMIESNGYNINLSIMGHGSGGPFYELKAHKCTIINYINDFKLLKTCPGCENLVFNEFKYCTPYGAYVASIPFFEETLRLFDLLPKKITIINTYDKKGNDVFNNFTGSDVTKFHTAIILTEETGNHSDSDVKLEIEYLKNNGFKWILAHRILYSYDTFVNKKLYYDPDMPNLELMIYEYGINFDEKQIESFRKSVNISNDYYYPTSDEKVNLKLYRSDGEKMVESLIEDGSIKKINDLINRQVVKFAVVMWLRKIPFYRDYIEHRIEKRMLESSYDYYEYNKIHPCILIEQILYNANLLGYEKREIIDRMEIACRYLQKYGLKPAYEMSKNNKKR